MKKKYIGGNLGKNWEGYQEKFRLNRGTGAGVKSRLNLLRKLINSGDWRLPLAKT